MTIINVWRLRGERRFPLEILALPGPQRLPDLAEIARSPAVSLFVERAQAQMPGFALTAPNAPLWGRIASRDSGQRVWRSRRSGPSARRLVGSRRLPACSARLVPNGGQLWREIQAKGYIRSHRSR